MQNEKITESFGRSAYSQQNPCAIAELSAYPQRQTASRNYEETLCRKGDPFATPNAPGSGFLEKVHQSPEINLLLSFDLEICAAGQCAGIFAPRFAIEQSFAGCAPARKRFDVEHDPMGVLSLIV